MRHFSRRNFRDIFKRMKMKMNEDDSDGEWEMGRGAFDAIREMQDEFDDE